MLILGRKPGQSIKFTVPPSDREQHVTVMVTRITPFQAKLGVSAPDEIHVLRTELTDNIKVKQEQPQ